MSSVQVRIIAIASTVFFAFLSGCNPSLDRGGTYWILRVELGLVAAYELEALGRWGLRARAESDGFSLKSVSVQGTTLVVETPSKQAEDGIAAWVADGMMLRIASHTPGRFELVLTDDRLNLVQEQAMSQVVEVLQRRIGGIRGSAVTRQGANRILVQIPDGQIELGRARKLLVVTGFLEFKIVMDSAQTEELLRDKYPNRELPEDTTVAFERDRETGRVLSAYLVGKEANVTGDYLMDARPSFDNQQRPQVDFTFNPAGGEIFQALTEENIGAQLAIILDDRVYSAPTIRGRISTRGTISGRFTLEEVVDLSVVLRAGSLSVPVVIEEERTVGKDRVGQAGGADEQVQ